MQRAEETSSTAPPPAGSVERWCWDLITGDELQAKLAPAPPPDGEAASSWEPRARPRRLSEPGRPRQLEVLARSERTPTALVSTAARARMVHTFLHHELQAAELFAWAVLAFPGAPRAFRAGLLRLCLEELGHLHLYREHLETLGAAIGDFPVRDWFWERVGSCREPLAFVALQGLGLEGSNLDHSARFARAFREAGDERGARILEQVGRDEVAHVAFAVQWFEHFSGAPLDYERWCEALPTPLTPALMQGRPLNGEARRAAGLNQAFLSALADAGSTTEKGRR